MNATVLLQRIVACLFVLAVSNLSICGQETPQEKQSRAPAEKPPAKPSSDSIRQWIEDLSSTQFKTREAATQRLSNLQEAPESLSQAIGSANPEVRRRAQFALDQIKNRQEEKAFQALAADLRKIELDRFVRRMVTDAQFRDEKQWEIVKTIAKAVTRRATELSGQHYPVPEFDMKSLPFADFTHGRGDFGNRRIIINGDKALESPFGAGVILCTGHMSRPAPFSNSILIVDGDFGGSCSLDKSLLIVRGNVGRFTSIRNSIILATGNFVGATACDNSFFQVNNQKVRFTSLTKSVLVKTKTKTTHTEDSQTIETERGPLQLLKFSERKTDDQLAWGKPFNDLAVAIAPADEKDKFLVRWKNVGKDFLEIPWARKVFDLAPNEPDELHVQVFLRGADGKVAPFVPCDVPKRSGSSSTAVLGPGQVYEEVIDLWTYVQKPTPGKYQLSIELELKEPRRRNEFEAKLWLGKVATNVLEIDVGR
jgi:hypothetical protein